MLKINNAIPMGINKKHKFLILSPFLKMLSLLSFFKNTYYLYLRMHHFST
ncbi:hypothetical protein HMPREF6123_2144 [Oribacterium sinus F0268]|uniref:Uncharacterized protein n=1 Tax=Oribacterium sinus F0268 TaxID=585501 RepID=C2L075_9FIRM|nr:hypothetical protein HMPREF6123_2144 [Oribacterium sinus F0268]